MEILVIHSKEIPSPALFSELTSQGNKIEHWLLEQNTQFLNPETLSHLKNFSHFFYIGNAQDFSSPESLFLLGFFYGQSKKVLFMLEDQLLPTLWASDFTLVKDFQEAIAFFRRERNAYEEQEKRHQAEKQLRKRGRELTRQDFVSAVIDGDGMSVSLYIQVGFSANSEDKAGISVLHWAVRKNHVEITAFLLEAGANVNLRSQDRGHTPLMDAAIYGNKAMLDLLLQHKPDLDVQSSDGQTALVLMMGRDKEDLVLDLLQAGANPDIPDKLGMSARGYAGLFGKKKVLEYLGTKD
jgi:hypothetical protein